MDLIIGASRFPGKKSGFDQGAVYIYVYQSDAKSYKLNQTLYGDEQDGALFGYSVANAGDLNGDGFEDIVVGAPWGGPGGKGRVFLYYGDAKNIKTKATQVLEPSSFTGDAATMDGFGFSLDGNKDMDDNGYPDLAIGSYRSDHAVIVRSRPVATVLAEIKLPAGQERINLDKVGGTSCTASDGKSYKWFVLYIQQIENLFLDPGFT